MKKIQPQKIEGKEMTLDCPREIYPYFNMSLKHLPEAEKWEIGKTYYLTLELKQTGINIRKHKEEEKQGSADFEITGIEVKKNYKKNYKELPDKE